MGRSTDWGQREKHPLYNSWHYYRRKVNGMVPEWHSDFWVFVSGVGDRPSDRHRLRKHNAGLPIGPDNFFWSEVYFDGDHAAYQREYRKRRPDRVKNTKLKKMFGITLDDYEKMFEMQGGVCAICCGAQSGGMALCVDHCHRTGTIRGLLCHKCNRAIGLLKDDHDAIMRAARYLMMSEAS